MEEQKVQGTPLGAFLVGGCIAVVMQVVMVMLGMVLPADAAMLVPPMTLVILGFIGMALVLAGAYTKLNEIGGFGAGIMFCGLVDAVSGIFAGATLEAGGKREAGVEAAIKFAIAILGSISLVGAVVGFILGKAGNVGVLTVLADTTTTPVPLVFALAFLMGGAISIIGQIMIQFLHLPTPMAILIEGACGMLMSVFGVFAKLEALTGAGLVCTVVDAGGGMVAGGALLAVAGTPMRIVIIAAVMVIVVVIGILTGNILVSRAEA